MAVLRSYLVLNSSTNWPGSISTEEVIDTIDQHTNRLNDGSEGWNRGSRSVYSG